MVTDRPGAAPPQAEATAQRLIRFQPANSRTKKTTTKTASRPQRHLGRVDDPSKRRPDEIEGTADHPGDAVADRLRQTTHALSVASASTAPKPSDPNATDDAPHHGTPLTASDHVRSRVARRDDEDPTGQVQVDHRRVNAPSIRVIVRTESEKAMTDEPAPDRQAPIAPALGRIRSVG